MKRFTTFACLALTLAFALNAYAVDYPQRALGHDSVIHGGSTSFAKAECDTIFLIGPGTDSVVNGEFENPEGLPAWNGWTHRDLTQVEDSHWQISSYNAVNGDFSAYCGDATLPACDEDDVIGGYGNNYSDILQYTYTVDDPNAGCTMTVSGTASSNTEPGYDYVIFRFLTSTDYVVKANWDDIHSSETFTFSHSYAQSDYVGPDGNQVRFEIAVESDGAYSDEDCDYSGNGAAQIDDLTVTATNGGLNDFTDFEDGGLGNWIITYPAGVGDYAGLWSNLEDNDPCFSNYTPQVAFINDGTLVEGVEPSVCINWCYGPGGYIVNTSGGASTDPLAYLYNALESPIVEWPQEPGYIGGEFTFGIYRHEDLTPDSPGMFYTWSIRTAVNQEDIENAEWRDRNFVYYGGPDYIRAGDVVTDLLEPGLRYAQVQLTCYELGWRWAFNGDDGFPAPYFDNVRLTAFCQEGPGLSTREIDLANDNWPAQKFLNMDPEQLASNRVRFDNAQSKRTNGEEHNIPGDSITCDIASVRSGGLLVETKLLYTMQRNPVFDSVRDPAWGVSGEVPGYPAVNSNGSVVTDKYAFDLPDSGFLFPGDILHYYFYAADEVDHANRQEATLPADVSNFGDFSHPLAYSSSFTVRALPSVDEDGNRPGVLFWNDFASRGGENEWFGALDNLGLKIGEHYDVYYTNGPSSGVGNGLGGRASLELVEGYSDILYTAGDLGVNTLSNGDWANDPSPDVQLFNNLVSTAAIDMFLTGDNLASSLFASGTETNRFLASAMNLAFHTNDIRPNIHSQTTPVVRPVADNGVFFNTPAWIAYGGCSGINQFDGVEAGDGATRLARFTDNSGNLAYNYSAATLNISGASRIVSLPYDFMFVYTDQDDPAPGGVAARVKMLEEVLGFFGVPNDSWVVTPVPEAEKFFAKNYPNPFNPTTKIEFNMPKTGHLSLKVYNVRGELVKTLIDESRDAGPGHIMWDGTSDQGSPVSSGVYFYEARTAGEVKVNKMALVK